jgi:hypothetical protein
MQSRACVLFPGHVLGLELLGQSGPAGQLGAIPTGASVVFRLHDDNVPGGYAGGTSTGRSKNAF